MAAEPTEYAARRLPTPCEGCQHERRCAAELLACQAFVYFVGGQRWRAARREPTAARFARLYSADDDGERVARRGFRPATAAKLAALRTLSAGYPSLRAVFAAVGLTATYWEHVRTRDHELAAYVHSLVTARRPPPAARPPPPRGDLRVRILSVAAPQRSRGSIAAAANCNTNALARYAQRYPEVAQHVERLLAP